MLDFYVKRRGLTNLGNSVEVSAANFRIFLFIGLFTDFKNTEIWLRFGKFVLNL